VLEPLLSSFRNCLELRTNSDSSIKLCLPALLQKQSEYRSGEHFNTSTTRERVNFAMAGFTYSRCVLVIFGFRTATRLPIGRLKRAIRHRLRNRNLHANRCCWKLPPSPIEDMNKSKQLSGFASRIAQIFEPPSQNV